MVVHMQERQLVEACLKNDEHSVQEVQNLRDVEHVQNETNGRVLLVERAAHHRVPSLPSLHEGFNAHVGAKHHLHHVVSEFNAVQPLDRATNAFHD